MGFRSTFTTTDGHVVWPAWFQGKWAREIHFPNAGADGEVAGVISSNDEAKTYYTWESLPGDIQRALMENVGPYSPDEVVLVYLHECGGITRVEITRDAIKWTEPSAYQATAGGVSHDYCYGCSDADKATPLEGPPPP